MVNGNNNHDRHSRNEADRPPWRCWSLFGCSNNTILPIYLCIAPLYRQRYVFSVLFAFVVSFLVRILWDIHRWGWWWLWLVLCWVHRISPSCADDEIELHVGCINVLVLSYICTSRNIINHIHEISLLCLTIEINKYKERDDFDTNMALDDNESLYIRMVWVTTYILLLCPECRHRRPTPTISISSSRRSFLTALQR